MAFSSPGTTAPEAYTIIPFDRLCGQLAACVAGGDAVSCCANQPAWLSFMAHTTDKLADMRRYEDTAHVREQYGLSLGSYGRARMTMELQEAGLDVGERRVGKLMRINGIKTVRSARKNGPGGLYLTH